eukprot:1010723-Prorocentrum_minimum.AAC.4
MRGPSSNNSSLALPRPPTPGTDGSSRRVNSSINPNILGHFQSQGLTTLCSQRASLESLAGYRHNVLTGRRVC